MKNLHKQINCPHARPSRRGAVRETCPTCGRELLLTFHHLIPKKVHRRPRFARQYPKQQMNLGIYLCKDCHKAIHRTYSEMQLAQNFASLAALLGDETLQRHFEWLGRQRRC